METLRTDRKTDGGEKERGRREKRMADSAYEGRRRREEVELVLEWNEETAEGGGSDSSSLGCHRGLVHTSGVSQAGRHGSRMLRS